MNCNYLDLELVNIMVLANQIKLSENESSEKYFMNLLKLSKQKIPKDLLLVINDQHQTDKFICGELTNQLLKSVSKNTIWNEFCVDKQKLMENEQDLKLFQRLLQVSNIKDTIEKIES